MTPEQTDVGISSLIDTWLLLRDIELDGERNGVIYVLKSRGMAHSNQVREFRLTDHGIEIDRDRIRVAGRLRDTNRAAAPAAQAGWAALRSRDEGRHERSRR